MSRASSQPISPRPPPRPLARTSGDVSSRAGAASARSPSIRCAAQPPHRDHGDAHRQTANAKPTYTDSCFGDPLTNVDRGVICAARSRTNVHPRARATRRAAAAARTVPSELRIDADSPDGRRAPGGANPRHNSTTSRVRAIYMHMTAYGNSYRHARAGHTRTHPRRTHLAQTRSVGPARAVGQTPARAAPARPDAEDTVRARHAPWQ